MWFQKYRTTWLAIAGTLIFLLVIPAPFFLYQPGSVELLRSRITVENGVKSEIGGLHLTTVMSVKSLNMAYLLYGLIAPSVEVIPARDIKGDLSDAEYAALLRHAMASSQQSAVYAGLQAAGQEATVIRDGVFIRGVLPVSKAKGILAPGDLITHADEVPVTTVEQFNAYIAEHKKEGDTVQVTSTHGDVQQIEQVPIIQLASGRRGVGITVENAITVQSSTDVTLQVDEIGGPSAGLMFALEIVDQATPGNLTQGYVIAGTGTMNVEGEVGQVGGIRHKLAAAERSGIEIFFVPADRTPTDKNEKDARAEIKKRGYSLQLVPVHTLNEATLYLEKLTPKKIQQRDEGNS